MKILTAFCFATMVCLCISCNKAQEANFTPASVNIKRYALVILAPPKEGFKNLVVSDSATKRIFANFAELTTRRIILLPQGDYEIKADGLEDAAASFDEDYNVSADKKEFSITPINPPYIAFRQGQNFYTKALVEGAGYYMSILNLDGFPANRFSAEISGWGNVPLDTKTADNRINSAGALSFLAGNYTAAAATANGQQKTLDFTVVDNDTAGPTLVNKNSKAFLYRSSGKNTTLSFLISDPSGVDAKKTYLEVNGNRYTTDQARRESGGYRLDITVPLSEFSGKHDEILATLRMYDNDTDHGASDQSYRDERIGLREETGFDKTFAMKWSGGPVQYATVQCYSEAGGAVKEAMTFFEFSAYVQANEERLITIEEKRYVSLGADGSVTLRNMHENDNILFFIY